jgi:hypothetical protein
MHEPAACGALPAQQAKLHIGPLTSAAVGMLAHRIDSRRIAPRTTLAKRNTVEPGLCFFSFGTERSLSLRAILSWRISSIK